MQEVLLFGINELSERINYYISHGDSVKSFSVKGFVIDDEYFSEDSFVGKKIYRYSEAKEKFSKTIPIIICIGYKNMNENRKKIFYRLKDDGWTIESYISSFATIHAESLGEGNIILWGSHIGIKSTVGDCNIFDKGFFSHHSTMGNFNYVTNNSIGGNNKIGDCCFFGMYSCLQDGIKIHDKTLIGASCYLSHSTKKPGQCYAAPKAVRMGESEVIMDFWTSKNREH